MKFIFLIFYAYCFINMFTTFKRGKCDYKIPLSVNVFSLYCKIGGKRECKLVLQPL